MKRALIAASLLACSRQPDNTRGTNPCSDLSEIKKLIQEDCSGDSSVKECYILKAQARWFESTCRKVCDPSMQPECVNNRNRRI